MFKLFTSSLLLLLALGLLTTGEVRADSFDLVGDTFGTGAIQHDITSTNAAYGNSLLTFTVNFAGHISPASAGGSRSVFGYIDIDTDRNAATGADSWINLLPDVPGPALGLGAEYYIDLFSEEFTPGHFDIYNSLDEFVGSIPVNFSATSFTMRVPLALLGGSSGWVNYDVIVGTLDEATDRAPNAATPLTSTPVPEPATLLLLGAGLAAVSAKMSKRRRNSDNGECSQR